MITALGKELRRIRLDNDLLLKDMADSLNIKPSYLSAIENGRIKPSQSIVTQISEIYSLTPKEQEDLQKAYIATIETTTLNWTGGSQEQFEVGYALARQFNKLSPEQLERIKSILKDGE